uniref:Uncharacterized protein n=1 Tax=Anguilla anguilla TaxID=7936 RepID=A0A0E9WTU0_ANGAN
MGNGQYNSVKSECIQAMHQCQMRTKQRFLNLASSLPGVHRNVDTSQSVLSQAAPILWIHRRSFVTDGLGSACSASVVVFQMQVTAFPFR